MFYATASSQPIFLASSRRKKSLIKFRVIDLSSLTSCKLNGRAAEGTALENAITVNYRCVSLRLENKYFAIISLWPKSCFHVYKCYLRVHALTLHTTSLHILCAKFEECWTRLYIGTICASWTILPKRTALHPTVHVQDVKNGPGSLLFGFQGALHAIMGSCCVREVHYWSLRLVDARK